MNRTTTSFLTAFAVALSFARAETTPPANAAQHWAFHAPRVVAPPVLKGVWAKTDIDRFILAKLDAAALSPSPLADARTLIRRMTFDITGLPPSPDEVAAFAAASAENRDASVAALIDRLLASPRYGERWGRHWLDLARYSDTKGYAYSREERRFVHAPTYRDWVIGAFNRDLPYDRFLLLQMAADQLVAGDSPDLAAMGFITGGRRFVGVKHDIIDDRIDVVTRGAMALTVQCARCHDHKYDPISIEDYYSIYGVFSASHDRLVPLAKSDDAELAKQQQKLAETMKKRRDEAATRLRARVGDYLAGQLELKKYPEEGFDQILAADELIPASVRRWRDFLHTAKSAPHPIFAPWFAANGTPQPEAKLNPLVAAAFATPVASPADAAARYAKLFADAEKSDAAGAAELRAFLNDPNSPTTVPDTGIVNNDQFFPFTAIEELWKLQGDVERRLIDLSAPAALMLADSAPEANPRVFKRGSPSRLGDEVPRQFLEILSDGKPVPFSYGSGRLELARKIASAENPLTARVMVNRIWQHHFGTGLVKTASDFGLRAEAPSHPELLDWLARRFVAEGWSVKAMHRAILSSAVYQQSGSASVSERDPENRLLARFPIQRMEFEQLRDAMLAVALDLDLTTTGKSAGVLDAANKRRTVFSFIDRQFLPGVLRTFDFANPDMHVAVRHETTVPQQALFFLNGTFAADRARSLAAKMTAGSDEARIEQLHQALFQRTPNAAELATAKAFIAASPTEPAPQVRVTQWRYGTGEYDATANRLSSFAALQHFSGESWQGADAWPGGDTGWASLTAEGGHPGNTLKQACVRRWVAPRDCTVNISGVLKHEPREGDGVRAFIVHSGLGALKDTKVHESSADMTVSRVAMKAGETIDFIVDIGGTLSHDQFLWAPVINAGDAAWDAKAEFSGVSEHTHQLTPWEQYAQALLLSNEFAFID